MDEMLLNHVWLCVAALLAGAMNSIAGGGTLLTFPTLENVLHSAVLANGTSTVALMPGSIAGAWGFRAEMVHSRRWLVILTIPSLLGGAVGTWLVTHFDERYFAALVPWLLLLAATLFLIQPALLHALNRGGGDHEPNSATIAGVVFFQFLVAVYGGYFGAGIGILMLSSLGLMGLADIHRMNALKTFLAACINGVAIIIFVASHAVVWQYAVTMAVAAIAGGYWGATLSKRLNRTVVRWVVIAIGFGLAGYYFYKEGYFAPRPL